VSPFVWISLDERDSDPVRLWTHLLAAVGEHLDIGPEELGAVTTPASISDAVLPRLVAELDGAGSLVAVLDDWHLVRNPGLRAIRRNAGGASAVERPDRRLRRRHLRARDDRGAEVVSRRGWTILIVAGIVGAVASGIVAVTKDEETKPEAVSSLCASLQTLESSVQSLTGLSSSASKEEYQADVTAVQNAWDQVKTDAQDVQNASTGDLDSAWDDFESAVEDVRTTRPSRTPSATCRSRPRRSSRPRSRPRPRSTAPRPARS
jgi:hypothetical protein